MLPTFLFLLTISSRVFPESCKVRSHARARFFLITRTITRQRLEKHGDVTKFFERLFKFRKFIASHFLSQDPVKEIIRLNHFMGTKRSDGLIEQISGAINFSKMKDFMLASQKVYLLFWKVDAHITGYCVILTTRLY